MLSPVIKIRSTWSIIIDAAIHFNRSLAQFLVFSILPLVVLFLGTLFTISSTNNFTIIFLALPLYLFIYAITLLMSWETMWGKKPDIVLIVKYLFKTIGKFMFTMLLYWLALAVLPFLILFLIFKLFKFIKGSKTVGILPSIVMFLLVLLILPVILTSIPVFSGIGIGMMFLLMFAIVFVLSIPFILLMLSPPIILFQRCSSLKALSRSIMLSQGYWLHLLPFVLLRGISILTIMLFSLKLASQFEKLFLLNPNHLTFIIAGILYAITLPFFINLRVFYFQDLTLRKQGYNALLNTRTNCNCSNIQPVFSENF